MDLGQEHDRTSKIDNILRWVVLPFACFLAWLWAVFISAAILRIAEVIWFEGQTVSGSGVAIWQEPVKAWIYCLGAGSSAFLVVVTAFLVAPTSRGTVSWITVGIAGTIAFLLALATSAWDMFAAAIVTGLITAHILSRSSNRPANSASDDRPIGTVAGTGPLEKKWRPVLFVYLIAISTICFIVWFNFVNGYEFPAASSIASIEAELFESSGGQDSRFLVSPNLYDEILSALSPCWYDRFAMKWQVLGNLEIRTVEGGSIHVWLFNLGDKDVGAFAVGPNWESRRYCRGGNSAQLIVALEKAMAEAAIRQ